MLGAALPKHERACTIGREQSAVVDINFSADGFLIDVRLHLDPLLTISGLATGTSVAVYVVHLKASSMNSQGRNSRFV